MRYFIAITLLGAAWASPPKEPLGLPPVPWPQDNPYSEPKAELGRALFYDKRLSSDGTISCASCHSPGFAFAVPDPIAKGVEGRQGTRNAPTVINAAFFKDLFWDGRADSLEAQCLGPLANPVEMTLDETPHAAYLNCCERVNRIGGYKKLFEAAFGTEECSIDSLSKAIATFERTILSGNSRYDRYLAGDKKALSEEELEGWRVFNKSHCASCHGGPLFSDGKFYNIGVGMDKGEQDLGRYRITHDNKDWGAFKSPTLREISCTAPYMHDGSLQTLEEVVDYYDKGGNPNPNLHPLIKPLHLSAKEKKALVAFLRTLNGEGWQHASGPDSLPK